MPSQSPLTSEEVLGWFGKAINKLDAQGRRVNPKTVRSALADLGAPVRSESVLRTHGFTWWDVKQHFLHGIPLPDQTSQHHGHFFDHVPNDKDADVDEVWDRLKRHHSDTMSKIESNRFQNIVLPDNGPVGLILMGDIHIGSAACDYERLEWIESQVARTDIPIYVVQVGDVFDAMFLPWARMELAKQRSEIPEQIYAGARFLRNITDVPERDMNPLIGVCAGNHDLWSDKQLGISFLDYAFALAGTGNFPYDPLQLNLSIELGSSSYLFVLRHKLRGNSQYNPAHGGIRWHLFNDKYEDADAIVAGHTHRSGHDARFVKGRERHTFQLGAYKESAADSYAVEQGFSDENRDPDMFAILWPDRHLIEAQSRTYRGIRELEAIYGVAAGEDFKEVRTKGYRKRKFKKTIAQR